MSTGYPHHLSGWHAPFQMRPPALCSEPTTPLYTLSRPRILSGPYCYLPLYAPMKHPVYFFVGGVVLVASAWLAWAIARDNWLRNGFNKIETGTTEQEVLQELGLPKRVENCGGFFGPLPKEEADGCTKEYFYVSPFAPRKLQYYVVRFDANNHVRNTTPYSSP
jgi:hypothetical protein